LADAVVRSRGGAESRANVSFWRYACADGTRLWVEQWPDHRRAYVGPTIQPSDLEIWPAGAEPAPS
jgi:hypothetical protein